uniref:Uncharacterized protein n=1 Tax=Borodinellopsis insignis TaxID=3229915 RepID=A0AB39U3W1_9CHLO
MIGSSCICPYYRIKKVWHKKSLGPYYRAYNKELERSSPQRSSPQRSSPQRSSPQRSSPQRSSPQRSSPQRSSPQRSSPQRSYTNIEVCHILYRTRNNIGTL